MTAARVGHGPRALSETWRVVREMGRWVVTRHERHEQRRHLLGHPLFNGCTRSELRTLMRWGDEVEVPEGVTILRENHIGDCFVAVLSGQLTLQRRHEEIATVNAGGWTGDVAVLGFGPQATTVVTATTCRLFALGPRALNSFAVTMSGMRANLFPGLTQDQACRRVREMRAEGLPLWRQLQTRPPRMPAKMPEWLRVRAPRAPSAPVVRAPLTPHPVATSYVHHTARTAVVLTVAVVMVAAVGLTTVRVPYYTLRGGTRSATSLVQVSGVVSYPPRGQILFPVVESHADTALEAVLDWSDSAADVLGRDEVFGGQSVADVERANLSAMTGSKHTALVAALGAVGLDPSAGGPVVTADTGALGGPSGGLAFALALVDDLTAGELTGGQVVAATGTIADDGSVGIVGGMRLKTLAAHRAGATLLLVPSANFDDALAGAGSMTVIAVDSLAAALRALEAHGGEPLAPA